MSVRFRPPAPKISKNYRFFSQFAVEIGRRTKNFVHHGEQPPLYFWRDCGGHEIDILIDMGTHLIPVETKSARTVAKDFFNGLRYWLELNGETECPAAMVYGGDRPFKRQGVTVYPWFVL